MGFLQLGLMLASLASVFGQQRGTVVSESHLLLSTKKCTVSGGCVAQNTRVVLDANWRWVHGSANQPCYNNGWDPTLCPNPVTCAQRCYLDGATTSDYSTKYGITTSGSTITMLLYPPGTQNVGSRVYLMSDDNHYQLINLINQEVSFDVEVSGLPCGANGALYFTNMAADGGQSAYANNKAGAFMGTGYCDAQCPQDPKFINGEANMLNWNTNTNTGRYGSCCHEMDIWEANAASTAYTAHPCSILGQTRCDGTTTACGSAGVCDRDGCDFNPYRLGNTSYYGAGKTVNTNPGRMRVITQFKTSDGTATGALSQIKRTYIRGGVVIANAVSNIPGVGGNALSDAFCAQEKSAFGETNTFANKGGMASMKSALANGMVLTMAVWVDYAAHMLWLDAVYPPGSNPSTPGRARGPCAASSGNPPDVKAGWPNAQVTFENIKWGDIGTTYGPPTP